jgi:hypothetical protein
VGNLCQPRRIKREASTSPFLVYIQKEGLLKTGHLFFSPDEIFEKYYPLIGQ